MGRLHTNVEFLSVYSHFGMLLSSRPWTAVYYLDEFTQTHQKTTSNIDCDDPDSYKRFHNLENPTKAHSLFLIGKKKKEKRIALFLLEIPWKHPKMEQKQRSDQITQKIREKFVMKHHK